MQCNPMQSYPRLSPHDDTADVSVGHGHVLVEEVEVEGTAADEILHLHPTRGKKKLQ